jgi:hypothetical protein
MGSGAKLYMRKGFLIYEEMRKYLTIYKEAVSHTYMTLHPIPPDFLIFLRKILFSVLSVKDKRVDSLFSSQDTLASYF